MGGVQWEVPNCSGSWESCLEKAAIEMALASSSLPGEEVGIVTLYDMVVNCEFYFTDSEATGGFN